ncbi:MAG: DNA starvation/stationary phase protection protein Dps [Acidobacteria bacterium]|nr:DNA starvation/stationary phase protection protein Dps [Acidobacteriota bacterium]
MHKTKNDLPEKVRVQMITLLQERLAEALDLGSQAKQAHWNVKGQNFIALHELFDEVYEHVDDHVDMLAERVIQFGGIAEGTIRVAAKRSQLPEYPLTLASGKEHVEALSRSLAYFGETIRKGINQADEIGDKGTADLFTEISRSVDKDLWFVEAHAQNER